MQIINSVRTLWEHIRLTMSSTPARPTILRYEDMQTRYFESLQGAGLQKRTLEIKESMARVHIAPAFGGREVRSIRPWEVAAAIKAVHDRGMLRTSRMMLSEIRAMLNVALIEGWIESNPAQGVKRLPAPVRRRRITLEQFLAIRSYGQEHLQPWFAACITLALVTGQRRADISKARTSDVRDGHFYVEQQKTGARLAIPLALRLDAINCSVGEAIEACLRGGPPPAGDDYLLRLSRHGRRGQQVQPHNLSSRFCAACHAVLEPGGEGNPPSFHELRSLSARLYRAQGVDAQALLGHTKAGMTEIYENDRGLTRGQWKYVPIPEACIAARAA